MHDRSAASRTIAFWLAIGVLGGLLFFWRMRAVDPDRAIRWRAESAVAAEARALLRAKGFTPPTDSANVQLVRETTLLDSLQRRMGRPALIAALQSDVRGRLAAYVWVVRWTGASENPMLGFSAPPSHEVHLDAQGRMLGLRVLTVQPEQIRPDSAALRATGVGLREATAPVALPPGHPPVDGTPDPGTLTDTEAGILARHHLGRTPLGSLGFVVDSVRAAMRPGLSAARVLLHSTAPELPIRYATVEVDASGALLGLNVRDVPRRAPIRALNADSALTSVRAGLAFLVLIAVGVAFVRRLSRRQVDVSGSLRDALFTALLGCVWIFISGTLSILESAPSTGWAVFIVALNVVLIGAATGFAGMAAAGTATSLAQPRWPEKLHGLALLRRGALHDGRVGRALLRGTCAALAALGLIAVALEALPRLPFYDTSEGAVFMHEVTLSPLGFAFSWPLLFGYMAVMAVLVPAAALGERSQLRRVLCFGGAVLLVGVVDATFGDLTLLVRTVTSVAVAALAFTLLLRYDVLTALTVFFVVGLVWLTREGWLATASPTYADSLIAFAVVAVLLLLGVGGTIASIETATDEALVPEYLVEHAKEARVLRELEIAHTVQRHFLPASMPAVPGAEIAATCVPASEVGGDMYDFVMLSPTRVALAIGDVSGKGIQAAFVMTLVKGFLQTLARDHALTPCDVLSRMNGLFRDNVPRGAFITMTYGVLDMETRTFTYARAGHCPLMRCRTGQPPQLLRPAGAAIGLAPDALFHASLHEQTLRLEHGDTLVLFTDGFSEAHDVHHELYGDERLVEAAGRTRPPSSSALIDALLADVNGFAGEAEQHDDMTMVVVRILDEGADAAGIVPRSQNKWLSSPVRPAPWAEMK